MAKELYLYSPIYDFVAQDLIASMEEFKEDDITIRENTPGGNVFATYGICAKMQELGNINIKVDGAAMSSGANMLMYAQSVECLDVSKFLFHRADMYVSSPEDQAFLDNINKDLKAKMKLKFNADKFKEITGYTIDEMFNSEKRIDIVFTAKDMKDLGVVKKITKLTPLELTAFNNKMFSVAAEHNKEDKPEVKIINMNLDKLKAEHPALYQEVLALGVAQEKDRAGAWLAFVGIDAEAVAKGIKDGNSISQTAMAELSLKSFSVTALKNIEADSTKEVKTKEVEAKAKTAEEKEVEAFEAETKKILGIK